MNFFTKSYFIFLLIIIFFSITPVFGDDKIKIAVLDFETQEGISSADAQAISEMFRTEIVKNGTFNVIERNQINNILKEQEFQQSGCTDTSCAVEIGKILSLNKIIIGTVGKLFSKIIINVRLIDVESGEILLADKADSTEENIIPAIENLVQKISAAAETHLMTDVTLKDVDSLIKSGNYDSAKTKLDIYINKYGSGKNTDNLKEKINLSRADEKYTLARKAYDKHLYRDAKNYMEEALNLFPQNETYQNFAKKINDKIEEEKMSKNNNTAPASSSPDYGYTSAPSRSRSESGINAGFDLSYGFGSGNSVINDVDFKNGKTANTGLSASYASVYLLAFIFAYKNQNSTFDEVIYKKFTYEAYNNYLTGDITLSAPGSSYNTTDLMPGFYINHNDSLGYTSLYFDYKKIHILRAPGTYTFTFNSSSTNYKSGNYTSKFNEVNFNSIGLGGGFRNTGANKIAGPLQFFSLIDINAAWINKDSFKHKNGNLVFQDTTYLTYKNVVSYAYSGELGFGLLLDFAGGLFFNISYLVDGFFLNYDATYTYRYTSSYTTETTYNYTYNILNQGILFRFGYIFDIRHLKNN